MAFNNSRGYLVDSVNYAALTAWAVATAKVIGNVVRQVSPSLNNERAFMCTTAGTTHATTEPTWDTSRGGQTTDNTVTWLEVTGNSALNGDITNTPNWTLGSKNQGVSRGHIIKNDAATHLFICTTSGTGHATTEPTWNTTTGTTTTDNSVTWKCIGSVAAFGKFAVPHARMQCALANFGNGGGTDQNLIYVSDQHAETQSSNQINWSSKGSMTLPLDIICIDRTGNVPPTSSSDLKETATITTTTTQPLTINGVFRVVYGIIFSAGSTSGNVQLNINTESNVDKNFEKCKFRFGSGAGSGSQISFSRNCGRTVLRDCEFKFSNVGQGILTGGQCKFENCSVDSGGSNPSVLVQGASSGTLFEFEGCDLSFLSGSTMGNNGSGNGTTFVSFNDCKFPASFTPWAFTGSNSMSGEKVIFNRCSSGGNPLQFISIERSGTMQHSTTIYRDGGAEGNSVPYSWWLATTANMNLGSQFFEMPTVAIDNSTTGADVTITGHGIVNAAAVPTNAEVWMEAWYLGSASDTQGTRKSSRVVDFVTTASNLSADTGADWDLGATARANTHAYSLGDIIKLASNPGRIFFCTTAGTSAGSEPGGYSSAVDGGSVTDGTAIFRAGFRFQFSVTLTSPQPQLAGLINVRTRVNKQSSTLYIDPLFEVT